jgi:hypothetical protein
VDITFTRPPPAPAPGSAPGARDTLTPRLTNLTIAPATFTAANSGGPVLKAVGGRVFYRLSEPASVRFRVERALSGRRRAGRCVPAGAGRRCTRYTSVRGSFGLQGAAGLNDFRFMGRLRNRALPAGSYRLVAVARDLAGNLAKPVRRAFRIRG